MVKVCVVHGCHNSPAKGITLHEFPKEKNRCRQWIRFVQRTRKWESKPQTSHICSSHFARDAISNHLQVEMGIAKKVNLQENAVPTIYPPSSVSASSAIQSDQEEQDGEPPLAPENLPSTSATQSSGSRSAFMKREIMRVCYLVCL